MPATFAEIITAVSDLFTAVPLIGLVLTASAVIAGVGSLARSIKRAVR